MNEISVNRHEKAEELRQGILTSFTLVQKNLWDLCMKLKEMRDTKLYKELGYGEFNDFTTAEIRMSDRNVYRYIAIAEKVNPDLVTSMSLNSMTKLSLLAELSTEQQVEIAENVDLESATVRELREEVNKLKGMKMRLENLQAKIKAAAVPSEAPDKGKQEFKIFLVMAHDALERLIAAANGKDDIYKAKIRELLKAAEQKL